MTTINLPLPAPAAAPAAPSASSGAPGAPAGAGEPVLPGAPAEPGAEGELPQDFAELLAALVAPLVAQMTSQPAPEPTVAATPVTAEGQVAAVPDVLTALASVQAVATPATAAGGAAPVVPTDVPVLPDEAVDVEEPTVEVTDLPTPLAPEGAEAPADIAQGTPDLPAAPATERPVASPQAQPQSTGPVAVEPQARPAEVAGGPVTAAAVTEDAVVEVVAAPVERAEAAPAAPQSAVTTPTVRVQDAAPVDAPAPARPAAPPHAQVAVAVTPLLQRDDGSYHVSLRLHPEELGGVHVEVELRNGEVHLAMRADNDAGRDALRASLSSLRAELEAAGVRAGSLDVADGMAGRTPDRQDQDQGRRDDRSGFTPGVDAMGATVIETDTSGADGAVDVRM